MQPYTFNTVLFKAMLTLYLIQVSCHTLFLTCRVTVPLSAFVLLHEAREGCLIRKGLIIECFLKSLGIHKMKIKRILIQG